MDFNSWLLFASIAFVATITPGPAILLVTTHSVSYGARLSTATMLGNITGLFIMSLLSVMGLSALILHSAPIFWMVKLFGAGYLVFLGVKLWRQGFGLDEIVTPRSKGNAPHPPFRKLFGNGLLVALSNPKAIAFTTALFPQFISPDKPMAAQFAILILTFMFLSFACLFVYALLAAETKQRSSRVKLPSMVMSKMFSLMFIGSGVFLATTGQK